MMRSDVNMEQNEPHQQRIDTTSSSTRIESTCRQNRNRHFLYPYFQILLISFLVLLYTHFLLFGSSKKLLTAGGLGYNTDLLSLKSDNPKEENQDAVDVDARSWSALLQLEKDIYEIEKKEAEIRYKEWKEQRQELKKQREEERKKKEEEMEKKDSLGSSETTADENVDNEADNSEGRKEGTKEEQAENENATDAVVTDQEKILKELDEKLQKIPSAFSRLGGAGKTKHKEIKDEGSTNKNTTAEKYRRRALPPFLLIVVICTSLRACVSLLIRFTIDDDGDETTNNNTGFLGRRSRGSNGIILGARARAIQRQQRLRQRNVRIANTLNAQRMANGERPISVESLSLVLSARDFTGDDYDELLQYNEENGPAVDSLLRSIGATEEEIARCPERVIRDENDDLLQLRRQSGTESMEDRNASLSSHNATTSSNNTPRQRRNRVGNNTGLRKPQTCAVCLEPYEVGDSVRTIPCFHTFHTRCIDPWLGQKAECPVCKYPALG